MKKLLSLTSAAVLLSLGVNAQASQIDALGSTANPLLVSGSPFDPVNPDSPDARIDANVPTSPFAGVVSLYMETADGGFICSGTVVNKRQVLTAGHCVDPSGKGVTDGITRARVLFNHDGAYHENLARNAIDVNLPSIAIHPDYKGFGICPEGVPGQCVNDDLAMVTLEQDIPAGVPTYALNMAPLSAGTKLNMVGYGTSGEGTTGFTIDPEFDTKRHGRNIIDLQDRDDEAGYASGPAEVWYADFDGVGPDVNGEMRLLDAFCEFEQLVCSEILANDDEAGIGPGDSGGPSFVLSVAGEYILAATNTFGGDIVDYHQAPGGYGAYFGGMLLAAYRDWLIEVTGGKVRMIPEPTSTVLLGLGLLGLAGLRRRKA